MWLSRYFVIFIIYSFMGWVYETTLCTIKSKKWENRGFLYGPICPIYGTGAVAATMILDKLNSINFSYTWWQVFIVCAVGSFFLEYGTHWSLERLFHAYWWDYSYMPLNIKGRVCLPYTLCFGGAGLLVVYVLAPWMNRLISGVSSIGFEFIGLSCMCIIGMDIALTASALANFNHYIMDAEAALNMHMEQFVETVGAKAGEVSDSMQAKIAEERDKYSKERIRNRLDAMSAFSTLAIKRVAGYKPSGKNRVYSPINKNRVLEFLKNRKSEMMNERESE